MRGYLALAGDGIQRLAPEQAQDQLHLPLGTPSLRQVLRPARRRRLVRNMDRAGGSQSVAMALSGHKTASVYRRYRIVAADDLREALARTQASLATRPAGTVTPLRNAADTAR